MNDYAVLSNLVGAGESLLDADDRRKLTAMQVINNWKNVLRSDWNGQDGPCFLRADGPIRNPLRRPSADRATGAAGDVGSVDASFFTAGQG